MQLEFDAAKDAAPTADPICTVEQAVRLCRPDAAAATAGETRTFEYHDDDDR